MRGTPTINDLRVKLCFICRDEETYDKPSDPPKRWIHPCKCTLIAHEECLLEWIRIQETNPDSKTTSLRKCPQCKEKYAIISDYPFALRTLDRIYILTAASGQLVLVCTFAAGITAACAGVYVFCTGYGSFAIQRFLGQEMYDMLIGSDPEKWPGLAFLNFPLIPISLILGRTSRFRNSLPFSSLIGWWPAVTPQDTTGPSVLSFFVDLKTMTRHLPRIRGPAYASQVFADALQDAIFSWPPSPAMLNIGAMVVPKLYQRFLTYIKNCVLGDVKDEAEVDDEGPLLEVNIQHDAEMEDGRPQILGPENPGANNGVPVVNGVDEAVAGGNEDRNRGLRLRMTAARMGMIFGGALLVPTIASMAGSILLRLTLPSYPRSHYTLDFSGYSPYHPKRLLCSFLGVKPPGSAVRQSVTDLYSLRRNMGSFENIRVFLALSTRALIVGTPAWTSADPVWWRNTVGFCIAVAAKDMIGLWHRYASRKEVASRRVKSRPFDGIDPKELDLKPFNLYDVDD